MRQKETERIKIRIAQIYIYISILEFYSEKLNRSRIVRYREFRILIYRVIIIYIISVNYSLASFINLIIISGNNWGIIKSE